MKLFPSRILLCSLLGCALVTTCAAQATQGRRAASLAGPPVAAAPYSGSGRIQQMNYGPEGAVNGFVFDNGTLARMAPFAGSSPSSIRVGATVAYSGYARNTISGRTVVDLQTLTIDGQTLSVGGPGPGGPAPAPPCPGGPAAARPAPGGVAPVSPGSPAPPAPTSAPVPKGRTDEPPPLPAPTPR